MKVLLILVALLALTAARPWSKTKVRSFRNMVRKTPWHMARSNSVESVESVETGAVELEDIHELVGEELKDAVLDLKETVQEVMAAVQAADPMNVDMAYVESILDEAAMSVDPDLIAALRTMLNRVFAYGIENEGAPSCARQAGGCVGVVSAALAAATQELFPAGVIPAECATFEVDVQGTITSGVELIDYLKNVLPCVAYTVARLPDYINSVDTEQGDAEATTMVMEGLLVRVDLLAMKIFETIGKACHPVAIFMSTTQGRTVLAERIAKAPYDQTERFWGMVSGVVAVGTVFGWW